MTLAIQQVIQMSNLKQKVKGTLYSKGYTLGHLAKHMNISSQSLSMLLVSNMKMANALRLNDELYKLTNTTLTLEDFRG